jgi:hypothetical protein
MNEDINDIIAQINIIPSKLDDLFGKACPCAQDENETMSSVWNFLHETFNSRLARDLKMDFLKFNVQHEVEDGNTRLDIRIVTDYKNTVFLGDKNVVVIDLKTGKVKLYQLCMYALRNHCPVIIAELLSGDAHLVTYDMASKILVNVPAELEKINELKSLNAVLPGKDCKLCSRSCEERLNDYSPYRVSSTTFIERALKLETNYNKIRDQVQQITESLLEKVKTENLKTV